MNLIGFDVGGTKIEATLISVAQGHVAKALPLDTPRGPVSLQVVTAKRAPTERHLGYDHIVKTMCDLARAVCEQGGVTLSDIELIGAALPGSVHPRTGQMIDGNTMALIGRDLVGDLKRGLGFAKPIAVANDANCFALAEALCGAGRVFAEREKRSVRDLVGIGVILGTGCGGGVVIDGKMLVGSRGGAAEFGHSILVPEGHPCYCGRSGCAEQYLSGPAIEALFNTRHYAQINGTPTAGEIFELCEKLDPVAVAVVKQYQRHLAQFLGNLVCYFDPDFIVLGGGVSRQSIIYKGLSEMIAVRTFLPDPMVPVFPFALSDAAGALGAALHVMTTVTAWGA